MKENINMKELIDKYKTKEKRELFPLSFQIEPVYNKHLNIISNSFEISKSFLLRIVVYEFINLYAKSINLMEHLICPICGSNNLKKTNKGVGEFIETALYECDNGDVFMARDLNRNKKIDEFFPKKNKVKNNERKN